MNKKRLLLSTAVLMLSIVINVSGMTKFDSKAEEALKSKESTEWTHSQKVSAYQLDDVSLQKDTESLLEEVLAYPYLMDVLLYDDLDYGLERVSENFNGLKELLSREDLALVLEDSASAADFSEMNFAQEAFFAAVSRLAPDRGAEYVETTVTTCLGSSVSALRCVQDYDSSNRAEMDTAMDAEYPNTERIRGATGMYNCHSYAWYDQSTTNDIWINFPLSFKTDGYQVQTSWAAGDRIVYSERGKDMHSGIIEYCTGSNLASVRVISKWGPYGLYRHDGDDCPYTGSGVTVTVYRCAHTFGSYKPQGTYVHCRTCTKCGYSQTQPHSINPSTGRCYVCGGKGVIVEPWSLIPRYL